MKVKLKILLIEDNPADAEMVQRLLQKEKLDFEPCIVMNRVQFLRALEEFHPDLILSDNSLPGFSATEALEIYNQLSLSIPFILVTGTVSEEFAAGIIKLGADDYILKDRLTRLPSAIENALLQRKTNNEKREAIQKLKFSEENLNAIFENASEGFILTDTNCIVRAFNDNGKRYAFFNTAKELVVGSDLFDYIAPSGNEYVRQSMIKVLAGEKIQYERLYEKKGYPAVWLLFTITPVLKNGSITGTCVTTRDVTERKRFVETKLVEQKKMSRAIIKAQENERNYLGQELHDNINQILAGAKIYLDKAMKDYPALEGPLIYPLKLINMSMEEIRMLCRNLVTPLNNTNIEEQVQSLLENLNKNLGIGTRLIYDVKNKIDDDLNLNIYRIIQEQINNIVKHAQAAYVEIAIKAGEKSISVIIIDDGQGFDIQQKRTGIGLSNMINRVESFNGNIIIESAPGKGCKTQIVIPLHSDEWTSFNRIL
jgi:two-component system sensor histidine kinase UhpB